MKGIEEQSMRERAPIAIRRTGSQHQVLHLTYAFFDLSVGTFMLVQPSLFAELIYPPLTPYGVLLAIHLLAWYRLGRFMSTMFIPKSLRDIIVPWLWLTSAPLHCISLLILEPQSTASITWHTVHLILIARLWSIQRL